MSSKKPESKPVAKSQARVLPPKYKFIMDFDFTYRPTFFERVKILFGFRIDFKVFGQCEHSPGKYELNPMHRVINEL